MPSISIILPIYNAVKYIGETLDSLLRQSFSDFELIIVDDGATDGSEQICVRYAEKDKRIRLIHQKNGGISCARNTGLNMATGKWIAFCDHDDLYDKNYLEKAITEVQKKNVDLLKFEYHTVALNEMGKEYLNEVQQLKTKIYSVDTLSSDYMTFNQCIRVLWNGFYKRKIIVDNNLTFDTTIKMGMEDYDFNLRYTRYCNKIGTLHECLYTHFMRNSQSTSAKFGKNKLCDIQNISRKEKILLTEIWNGEEQLFPKAMHNAVYVSNFLEQITIRGNTLSIRQKINYLRNFRDSGAVFSLDVRGILRVYKTNWRYAIKLHMFEWHLYYCLIAYQYLNDRRKGR